MEAIERYKVVDKSKFGSLPFLHKISSLEKKEISQIIKYTWGIAHFSTLIIFLVLLLK